MPAPKYVEPVDMAAALELREELLGVVKKIRSQLSYKSRQHKDTGVQMTQEEFEVWRVGAKTALTAASRDLSRVDLWIKSSLLDKATKLLTNLAEDGMDLTPEELGVITELREHQARG